MASEGYRPTISGSFLRVAGTRLVDEAGKEIVLRGAGLGSWMIMENFISGFPRCEFQIREALAEVLGESKSEFFFDKFLEYFFTDSDASFFASLGLNCIRIAINYRHFESDLKPRQLITSGFKHLDRVIRICASYGIYTIIDLHTAPGGQNGGWHCDSGVHLAGFWRHKDFMDRATWLWIQLANRYKDEPWVAGYNLLNEPADEFGGREKGKGGGRLVNWYDETITAVRNVDNKHILFLDGNTYATDFSAFPDDVKERWPNCAYAIHDYSVYGFPSSPEPYSRTEEQQRRMGRSYKKKREWMDERGLCVWNGEWGPVYAREEYEGKDRMDEINERRYMVLNDQLQLYKKDGLSWSIWLYKDIGFQGMVHVSKDTQYMKLFKEFLAKKHRTAVDSWGADDSSVKHLFNPIISFVQSAIDDPSHLERYPYPVWTVKERVARQARAHLLGELLAPEWAEYFRGMEEAALEEIAKSFLFENCVKREGLNDVLKEHAKMYYPKD